MQQGDHGIPRVYESEVVNAISQLVEPRILVLGSGAFFSLEKRILAAHSPSMIVSCDVHETVESIDSRHIYKKVDLTVPRASVGVRNFDVVVANEVLEHLPTDKSFWPLIKDSLKAGGLLIVASPNLASLATRVELLLGYQPHVLEGSGVFPQAGMGMFARLNGANKAEREPLGHIRGIAHRALTEIARSEGFLLERSFGYTNSLKIWPKRHLVGLAGVILYFFTNAN